jgi:hypothetical protein
MYVSYSDAPTTQIETDSRRRFSLTGFPSLTVKAGWFVPIFFSSCAKVGISSMIKIHRFVVYFYCR